MVVLAAAEGFRLAERPVPLYPRHSGKSKFGIGRIPVGVLDLVSVGFQLRFGRKPMLFFGVAGAVLFLLGSVVGLGALWFRFGPAHVGFRALLDPTLILVISGTDPFGLRVVRARAAVRLDS